MGRTYQTLAPARFQVRNGIGGGWYVIDTAPETYSRLDGSRLLFRDTFAIITKNGKGEYYRTYAAARNLAAKLNG